MKAVILAGGFGKRLRPYTESIPKPLVEVAGKPILEWQVNWLKNHGIKDFVFLVGYLKEKIIEFVGSGNKLGIRATYVVEDSPLGTAGALKNAEPILANEDVFIVVNGDIITNLNPIKLVEFLKKYSKAVGAIAAVPLRSPYGILDIENEYVVRFQEKPLLSVYWINAGVYAFRPSIFDYLPERGDIERTAFPRLAEERRLIALKYTDILWRSIDTYKDVEEASKEVRILLNSATE